ncbi:PREDICTED: cysteine-rich receptor-like protein kinase 1 [Nelumbo nucifera]|uniref:Cysteine-rich receptor-like protein kinase 1 n=1 Tax=Nelumbo nucifera TaxID=4432 RepID=A0A1U8Q2U4_NELNU|nr:PREDICTED: cysteine-rich receptor-like protein kinase 1 [Nelumbo nucifera]
MLSPVVILRSLPWVFLTFFLFFPPSLSDPRITTIDQQCGYTSFQGSVDVDHISKVVQGENGLAQLLGEQGWGAQVSNTYPPVYILAQCQQDLSPEDCLLCFNESQSKLSNCLPATSGRVYLDGCFIRYDDYNFFTEAVDPRYDIVKCSSSKDVAAEDYMKLEFAKKVGDAIVNVTTSAVSEGGFAVTEVKGGVVAIYAMAQCWGSLAEESCRECLQEAGNLVRGCAPAKEGRGLLSGCYLRYSTERFFAEYTEGTRPGGYTSMQDLSETAFVIAIALASLAFSLLALFGACVGYKRLSMIKKGKISIVAIPVKPVTEAKIQSIKRNNLGEIYSSMSHLNFKYEILEKATDSFNVNNKLGQGGAGSVFKGTLPDGKAVAVKRLFFNTRQWVDEFFNEVNLINGIQHKNLVKLLGCSIEGPESLLIYEYVPNKSLDQFLFDKYKVQILTWEQRFNIIVGIAEGIAYLHGGSETRIIHRDIKSSNVLLDEDLTAKIADFGLARCFTADKTHLSTGIAGTLGYMAPEYLVRGQLTEKADVYSFGVLVLEIVCGRKNSVFTQDTGSVLQTVWNNFKSNTLPESVDKCLKDEFSVKEASNALQIGLLCTQTSVSLRPSMSDVVQMLTNEDFPIPLPVQPPFLNASVMGAPMSTESYRDPISDKPTTIEILE